MQVKTVSSLGLKLNLYVPSSIEEFDALAKKPGAALEAAILNEVYRGYLAEFREKFCAKVEEATGIERKTKDTGKKRTVMVSDENEDGTPKRDEQGNPVEVEAQEPIFVFSENEGEFIKRVVAELNARIEQSNAQGAADAAANGTEFTPANADLSVEDHLGIIAAIFTAEGAEEIKFDPTVAERQVAGPRKLAAKYTKAAEELIKAGKATLWVSKYGGDGSVNAIATKLKSLEDEEAKRTSLSDKYLG